MRVLRISLLMLLLTTAAFAQDRKVEQVDRKNDQDVIVESYTLVDGKREGAYRSWYGDRTPKCEGEYMDDKREGNWRWYGVSGAVSRDWKYLLGELSGVCTNFYENGQKSRECSYAGGYAKGVWTEWYDSGQVSSKGQAYSSWQNDVYDPKRTGLWVWYHQNGKVSKEFGYVENKPDGECVEYYDSGTKRVVSHFERGVMKGLWTSWNADGQVSAKGDSYGHEFGDHKYPLKAGPWVRYHPNGNKYFEATYVQDKEDGPVVEYYESGEKRVESNFTQGDMRGAWTSYYKDGQVAETGEAVGRLYGDHKHPRRQGPWVSYHPNGQKKFECSFVDNTRDGPATEFYDNGQPYVTCTFDLGTLTDTWTRFYADGQIAALGEAAGHSYGDYHFPKRTGIWAEYFANGTRSFEGNYVDHRLDGVASWYHANGQKRLMAELVEGSLAGSYTLWFDNGNTRGHGHARGMLYGDPFMPIKEGPWVWYHSNGKKESEGKYRHNVKFGPWIYYDTDEHLTKVENHIDGESETPPEHVASDGSRVIKATGPDGSTDTFTFDKDGNLVSSEHTPPPDKQKPYITYTDPDTGETVTITHDGDGNATITHGTTTTDADGTKRTSESDDDGTTREIIERPDGSREITETLPDGTVRHTQRDKAGNVTRTRTNPDGTVTEYQNHPDGSRSRKRTDSEGNLVDETFRDPAGIETTNLPDGTSTRRHKDEDGNIVETTSRPDGGKSRVVRDKEGHVISRDDNWGERDAGRTVYEDIEGGRNWDDLTPEERKRYADREAALAESGGLDEARLRADEAAMRDRDAGRAESDAAADAAAGDLARTPASTGADKRKEEVNLDELTTSAKAVELALRMPGATLEGIQNDLRLALEDTDPANREANKAKIAELLDQDAKSLPGWLSKHPEVMEAWEDKVKPKIDQGASIVGSALAVMKGVDLAYKGEYGAALESFADASVSAFGVLPADQLEELNKELGRNPAKYAAAIKNVISFARELGRDRGPDESLNYGTLMKEGVGFMVNCFEAIPENERAHFLERNMPRVRKWLEWADQGIGKSSVKRSQVLMGVIDSAPEVFKLFSEWGGENDAANITSLAQKVGPKAVGMLVQAATRSETAGVAAEFVAQLGADYMANLGNEAREAAKGALRAKGQDANAYARMRTELNVLATKAGMSQEDANSYTYLSTIVSGHSSRLLLSDMRRKQDAIGVRESMQAWRRVEVDMGRRSGAVQYFYDGLVPDTERKSENEAAYQMWYRTWVDNARRTSAHINSIIGDYAQGSSARRFLATWKADLDDLVRVYG